jgi:hypothetical protein
MTKCEATCVHACNTCTHTRIHQATLHSELCYQQTLHRTSAINSFSTQHAIHIFFVVVGPRFFQTPEQCRESLETVCTSLKSSVQAEPSICSPDFLCASDSMYTSWSLKQASACTPLINGFVFLFALHVGYIHSFNNYGHCHCF